MAALSEEAYEEEHVHRVYDQIANHFSATRYKPWPVVDRYLSSLSPGSVGVDVGCGNGKYLGLNSNAYLIGNDRCSNLVRIASNRGPALVADGLAAPHPTGRFDFAISIAVIHHFSTPERRREGIAEVLRVLRPQGTALFFVWALEQQNSRRGWKEGDSQDVYVPWVLGDRYQGGKKKDKKEKGESSTGSPAASSVATEAADASELVSAASSKPEPVVYQRYYHLFKKGELEECIQSVGGTVMKAAMTGITGGRLLNGSATSNARPLHGH
ncbi:tRNA methyltransferase Trm9 [Schizosaccharomyces japonicus yFS275]|uniref:tRNA methyltransferase Trm9 n=1 Tax=Schizosaccharomyces japonicus (strain yFS275 / FY16936) TaxID=402676 RepID=B6JZK2_SCHJY|nr:tRNA methyltransferase Trm9 [Schizosaccharomyces japonicus yFS275]EEB06970.2 tRNA methyltransferase Trm9 [Schizosaccharomyces japonicus yFS275]